MFLSRVELDPRKESKLKKRGLNAYHGYVEQAFPQDLNKKARVRHLWRIDVLNHKRYLLIVSPTAPDLLALEKYGVRGTALSKDYQPFLDNIKDGQVYRFRLTANATNVLKFIDDTGKKRKKYISQENFKEHKKWLIQQFADNSGMAFLSIPRLPRTEISFEIVESTSRLLIRKGEKIPLACVSYEGVVAITNAEQAKKKLVEGIGREKAFGMGLMTLVPYRS